MKYKLGFVLVIMTFFTSCAQQVKENDIPLTLAERDYALENIVDGIEIPWGMTWLPDGSMLITEKSGELIHFKDGNKQLIKNVPEVYNRGQGGLLDIQLHPKYEENGWIYITYASSEGNEEGGNTALIRCKLNDGALFQIETLYKATPNTTKGQHFGSRIEFDDEEYLYFSIGERGNRDENPQDITRDGGKIYRLNDDGSVPKDNPFVDKENAKSAIYTYGNRNPQGMAKNHETGKIWIHEHGPKGGDEINIVEKGANYGWPLVTYGINYNGTSMTDKTSGAQFTQPIYYWVPSIAPSGMDFVNGKIYPNWKGNVLVGSLKFNYVEMLSTEGNKITKRQKIAEDIGRVRNVKTAPDGYIYIAVENRGIFKVVPK